MSRDIEFRVWDSARYRRMPDGSKVKPHMAYDVIVRCGKAHIEALRPYMLEEVDGDLMQYTGLKDKSKETMKEFDL